MIPYERDRTKYLEPVGDDLQQVEEDYFRCVGMAMDSVLYGLNIKLFFLWLLPSRVATADFP